MNNLTLQHFKRYPQLVWTLTNIHYHMKKDKYDFPLVICGGTGNGKTMLQLHIIELWYRVVLQQEFTEQHIKHVQNTRKGWINNFKNLKEYDINSNDEGIDGISSKEGMTRFGKHIQRLYNVFRKKLYFTIILIPDYFDLPLYFRKRIRGCIYVHKKGQFKYYTMENLKWVNALNETREMKKMEVSRCFFSGTFPDYQGAIRKAYDSMQFKATDNTIDEILMDIDDTSFNVVNMNYDQVVEMFKQGQSYKQIQEELGISSRDIAKIKKMMRVKEKLENDKEKGLNS